MGAVMGSSSGGGGGAQAGERDGDDRVGQVVGGEAPLGAVPLGQGVHGAEQQPADDGGVDVGTDVAVVLGRPHQRGDGAVELAASVQRRPLDLGVAAQPEQQ